MEAIGVFGSKLSVWPHTNLFPACKLYRFPVTSYPRKHVHFVPLKATANTMACEDEENNRNFRKLVPSKWDHQSLFANLDFSVSLSLSLSLSLL